MKNVRSYSLFYVLMFTAPSILSYDVQNYSSSNDTSYKAYRMGADLGIIDTKKYPFENFKRDERNVFRDLYKSYTSIKDSLLIDYQQWLIMNNYGILPDTHDPLFEKKITKRSTDDKKRRFLKLIKKGDILITGRGLVGLVGHAAIMTSDNIVLEMPGGVSWIKGIPDNNRKITKLAWFYKHKHDWTTVYRCKNSDVAHSAALWADRTYYNPGGGSKKTRHVTFMITTDMWSTNPSYCSKLVVQAYYFGARSRKVINESSIAGRIILPTAIPNYFLSPYELVNKGKF